MMTNLYRVIEIFEKPNASQLKLNSSNKDGLIIIV